MIIICKRYGCVPKIPKIIKWNTIAMTRLIYKINTVSYYQEKPVSKHYRKIRSS